MKKKYTFAVLGGDTRQAVVSRMLLTHGHSVKVYALGDHAGDIVGAEHCLSGKKAIDGSDIVILPLPVSRDGITLSQLSDEKKEPMQLEEIVAVAKRNDCKLLLGGMIPALMKEHAESLCITVEDYYTQNELQRKNALPSAEGAIMLAMENTDKVIEGMNVLVTGYGKTGKLLCEKLYALGAHVSVAARRDEVLCEIIIDGYEAVRISDTEELEHAVNNSDVIFNTVPHVIFTPDILSACKSTPLYIEIASSPGGIDIPFARGKGIRLIFAPSLPGKYAPSSAGKYIFETVSEILANGGFDI